MMPGTSGSRDTAPPLLVFKGNLLQFRAVLNDGRRMLETLADLLPRKSVVRMREEGGEVYMDTF